MLHLTGPNGSGKSTLLGLIAGQNKIQSGSIFRTGANGAKLAAAASVDYLAADWNGHFTNLCARDNLNFWLSLNRRRLPSKELERCLSYWGLNSQLLQTMVPVGRFSTGMRRRLALARMQLTESPCILLDEPTNGLDQKGCTLFRKFIQDHTAKGGYGIIVSHDRKVIEGLCGQEFALKH